MNVLDNSSFLHFAYSDLCESARSRQPKFGRIQFKWGLAAALRRSFSIRVSLEWRLFGRTVWLLVDGM